MIVRNGVPPGDYLGRKELVIITSGDLPLSSGKREFGDDFPKRYGCETLAGEPQRPVIISHNSLRKLCDGRCAMSGLEVACLLTVSHIIPWSKVGEKSRQIESGKGG